MLGLAKRGGGALILTGFDNWNKACEMFYTYVQSDIHKEAVLKVEPSKQEVCHEQASRV